MKLKLCAMVFLLSGPLGLAGKIIGREDAVQITLDRGDYQPRPMNDRTPLILRLERVTPAEKCKFTYHFHYISFEPGSYRLADYLIQPDGTPASDLGETPLEIRSQLAPDFQGQLNPFSPQPFPALGGYRMLLGGLAVLWLCGLPALIWLGRKKRVVEFIPEQIPTPTYAERLRPLVEAAAAGNLTATDQATLERLLTGFWREKIAQPGQRMSEALIALKAHPEAGALLRALEHWLHHPGGASQADIGKFLEPYRQPIPALTEEVAA